QDHHFSYHRHGDGFHRELRGGPRRSHSGGSVSLRLRGRPLRLSRPREALGLLWLAQRAHYRFADADKTRQRLLDAGLARLTHRPHVASTRQVASTKTRLPRCRHAWSSSRLSAAFFAIAGNATPGWTRGAAFDAVTRYACRGRCET